MNIDTNTPLISALAKKYQIDFVVLFGSQATGRTHSKSDIDIAVIKRGEVNTARLAVEFEKIFKRDDAEVINLASASPTLMHVVSRDGRLIYEKEPGSYLRWRVYAAKIWMDTEWLRRMRDCKLVEWSKNYNTAQA